MQIKDVHTWEGVFMLSWEFLLQYVFHKGVLETGYFWFVTLVGDCLRCFFFFCSFVIIHSFVSIERKSLIVSYQGQTA